MTTATDEARDHVGRGRLKVEAAVKRLGGAEELQGARAIDVGAGTGGSTEALLALGAREVTALDVGHDQLHAKLRGDSRVVSLERTNFKTVSLQVAPGPFDFFVIDVSFVAARTMLRPLAFRLRPGARGVILLKPQFELADRFVHAGKVNALDRAWALERLKKKGVELGFRLLGSADSPVAVASGAVEVMSLWCFEGPTGILQKGAAKPKRAAAPPEQRQRPERPARAERSAPRKPTSSTPGRAKPFDARAKPFDARAQPAKTSTPSSRPSRAAPVEKRSAKRPFEVPPLPEKPARHVKKPRRSR